MPARPPRSTRSASRASSSRRSKARNCDADLRITTMDIGFIGLGNMGFHMARRLIEAGHTVIALDTRKEALDRIVALGGKAAASAKEVRDRAEVVMASLPTPDVVL